MKNLESYIWNSRSTPTQEESCVYVLEFPSSPCSSFPLKSILSVGPIHAQGKSSLFISLAQMPTSKVNSFQDLCWSMVYWFLKHEIDHLTKLSIKSSENICLHKDRVEKPKNTTMRGMEVPDRRFRQNNDLSYEHTHLRWIPRTHESSLVCCVIILTLEEQRQDSLWSFLASLAESAGSKFSGGPDLPKYSSERTRYLLLTSSLCNIPKPLLPNPTK